MRVRARARREAQIAANGRAATSVVSRRRIKYGLTNEDYEAMLAAQGGVCAICRRHQSRVGKKRRNENLYVDHNHSNDKIRGLLCYACNCAIGMLMDDPSVIRVLLAYVENDGDPNPNRHIPTQLPKDQRRRNYVTAPEAARKAAMKKAA